MKKLTKEQRSAMKVAFTDMKKDGIKFNAKLLRDSRLFVAEED